MTQFIIKNAKRLAPVLTCIYLVLQIAWFVWQHH